MNYPIITNSKMDWGTEEHSFTFRTGGNAIDALDSLGDIISSLDALREFILENYRITDEIPNLINVTGGQDYVNFTEGRNKKKIWTDAAMKAEMKRLSNIQKSWTEPTQKSDA